MEPVPEGVPRPRWSVMIPTFNCAHLLAQTLRSVLAQDPGPEQMQIEVVDDVSTKDNPEAVIRELGKGRVTFHRKERNGGAVANFNTCIQRSIGQLVHILHGDDWVSHGFYAEVEKPFATEATLGLVAVRSFFCEEDGVIFAITPRLRELEQPSRNVESFYYQTPIQTPGVVVRRSAYERLGGFLPELVHTADCEMWSRIIAELGGVVLADVLAHYRCFAANDTGRLARTGENVRDILRLNEHFTARYSDFSAAMGRARAAEIALRQGLRFRESGEAEGAKLNLRLWHELASPKQRLKHGLRTGLKLAARWIGL